MLLQAAALVPAGDSETTADFLYHGHWLPVTPDWLARFPNEDAVTRYVVSAAAEKTLSRRWLRAQEASWTHWRSARGGRPAGPYKIYVSVRPDGLPVAFERTVDVFARYGVDNFKLARQPRALTRPDRLVAYCPSRAMTDRVLAALTDALVGLGPHGVPFTAAAPGSSAVSWAYDPPEPAKAYGSSWRGWVTRKLAGYLHASDAPDATGRSAFARRCLRGDGVNTDDWAPEPGLWSVA